MSPDERQRRLTQALARLLSVGPDVEAPQRGTEDPRAGVLEET